MLGYYGVKAASWLLCRLPKKVCEAVASGLGGLALWGCPAWRLKMAAANIEECLQVDAVAARKIAEESMRRFGRMVVEVLRFPLLNEQNIDELVHVEGLENIERAYAEGKGIVMVTGHFGNWELLGAAVALHGYPLLSVARQQNQQDMDRFINEYREMVGQKITYNRGRGSLLSIVRQLKLNQVVGLIYDQDTSDSGVELRLFGKDCHVPDGAAVLSRMNGAPIVPMFIHNNADGSLRVKVYTPMYCEGKDDYVRVMRELVSILEQEVREDPAMWFWVHDRWKDGRKRFDFKYRRQHHLN